jgi:FkbM family methyltransferase
MLRWMHSKLLANPLTRGPQRRLVRRLKDFVGCPDAYDDLGRICRKVRPAAVLDIGSHTGETVLKIMDEVLGTPVHAFEPTPRACGELRRRVGRLPNVHVHELALSDYTGKRPFFVNTGGQTNSLLDNAPSDHRPFEQLQQHLERIEVNTMTLDDWCEKFVPAGKLAVKADVQGAERLIIAGGQRTVAERVVAFYSEVTFLHLYEGQTTFAQLDAALREFGFVIYNIYPCSKDSTGRAAWTDVLWVRADVLPL